MLRYPRNIACVHTNFFRTDTYECLYNFFFFNNYDFKQFLTISQNLTLVNYTFTDRYSAGLPFFHVYDHFQYFAVGDGEGEIRFT